MTTSEQRLKDLVMELNTLANGTDAISPSTREAILKLEHRLDELVFNSDSSQSSADFLGQLETQFETDHPRTSAVIKEILATLQAMGI